MVFLCLVEIVVISAMNVARGHRMRPHHIAARNPRFRAQASAHANDTHPNDTREKRQRTPSPASSHLNGSSRPHRVNGHRRHDIPPPVAALVTGRFGRVGERPRPALGEFPGPTNTPRGHNRAKSPDCDRIVICSRVGAPLSTWSPACLHLWSRTTARQGILQFQNGCHKEVEAWIKRLFHLHHKGFVCIHKARVSIDEHAPMVSRNCTISSPPGGTIHTSIASICATGRTGPHPTRCPHVRRGAPPHP